MTTEQHPEAPADVTLAADLGDGCHFLMCSECSYPCACGDGEPEEPCAVRCGYVSSGRNLLEHQMYEHARCTECGRCPVGVSHEPDCPRLQPGYQYPAPADYL